MDDYRNDILARLIKEKDTVEFHRLQGKLEVIDDIIKLPAVARDYIKGLAEGKMKKI